MTLSKSIVITYNDVEYPVANFRQEFPFESFDHYVQRWMPNFLMCNIDEASTIRCSISGVKVADIRGDELEDMVRQACATLNVNQHNDLLLDLKDRVIIDTLESLLDQLATRVLLLARPAPSISMSKNQLAIGTLSKQRQLTVLVNQFLYDAGMFRDKFVGLEDQLMRLRKASAMADRVSKVWGDESADAYAFEDLWSGLVELDAKYRISALKFTRKEMETLKTHRESDTIDLANLRAFIWSLIRYRDEHTDVEVLPTRWTQAAYREDAFGSQERIARSNILQPPDGRHIAGNKSGGGVKVKSTAQKQAEDILKAKDPVKANQKATMANAVAAMFGSFKL